jgi:hypothetical protein
MTKFLTTLGVLVGATVVVLGIWFLANAWEAADEREDAQFKRECVAQGGKVMEFEGWRPACVVNGEKFYP